MNTCPSATFRQNHNESDAPCKKAAESISLEGGLSVMNMEALPQREKVLRLREEVLAAEEDRTAGRNGVSLDELDAYLDNLIAEA